MAMSISGSSSASSVVEGGGWVEGSGAEVVFGEAMISVVVTTVRKKMESQGLIYLRLARRYLYGMGGVVRMFWFGLGSMHSALQHMEGLLRLFPN